MVAAVVGFELDERLLLANSKTSGKSMDVAMGGNRAVNDAGSAL